MNVHTDLCGSGSDTSANVVGFKYYGLAPIISLLAAKNSREYLRHIFDVNFKTCEVNWIVPVLNGWCYVFF